MNTAPRVREPATHRFRVGELVSWRGPLGAASLNSVPAEVVRHLPPMGDDLQYRIKAVGGSREHVAIERELSAAGIDVAAMSAKSPLSDVFSIAIRQRSPRRS